MHAAPVFHDTFVNSGKPGFAPMRSARIFASAPGSLDFQKQGAFRAHQPNRGGVIGGTSVDVVQRFFDDAVNRNFEFPIESAQMGRDFQLDPSTLAIHVIYVFL